MSFVNQDLLISQEDKNQTAEKRPAYNPVSRYVSKMTTCTYDIKFWGGGTRVNTFLWRRYIV